MQTEKFGQKVVHQDFALDTYLSTLLDEIPSNTELDQIEQVKIAPAPAKQAEVKDKIIPDNVVETVNNDAESVKISNPLSVMPDWAQSEFQALFFKVDNIILAAPLTELLRTMKIEKLPTKIPGQPSWFMGLLDTHDQRIGVLDTGQLIYGKSRGQLRDLETHPFQSILVTHDGRWGLACDEILSIGRLEPDKVRWRTLRTKKPWLVGTVIEELTAIIDVNYLVPRRKSS